MNKPEYHVGVSFGVEVFTDFDKAAGFALGQGQAGDHRYSRLDVVIRSEQAARSYGGEDAVKKYNENPHADVFERFNITMHSRGMIHVDED